MSPEDKKEEEKKVGAASALHKITQTGYISLDVSRLYLIGDRMNINPLISSFVTSPADLTKFARGRYERAPRRLKLLVLSTVTLRINLCAAKSCRMKILRNMEVKLPLKLPGSSGNKANHMKVGMPIFCLHPFC